jgi:RimJ/RimL family protein N-acetyltransferase
MKRKESFIEGEIVYLRKPNIEEEIYNGEWHSWFNNMEITKYLTHGIYPIDKNDEAQIVEDELKNPKSFLLSIYDNETNNHIGVISLKSIDLINRNAEIGIVMGSTKVRGAALEAMALMTEHAFERLNLIRLYAGQHMGLWKWVNTIELIGYKIEGYRKNGGVRGQNYDTVLTGITMEDYNHLKKKRGGKLLLQPFSKIYSEKRKDNLLPKVDEFFKSLYNK